MPSVLKNLAGACGCDEYLEIAWEYWLSGGWLMIPLCLVCFFILYRYITLWHSLRSSLASPPGFMIDLKKHLENRRTTSTLDWLLAVPGAKARMVYHLLAYMKKGLSFQEGYRQCKMAELATYSHSFNVLIALVAAAPLLGLLGTVLGMIGTFEAVAQRSSETTQMVSIGISQALITTQTGLVAALPGTFGAVHLFRLFNRFKNDLDVSERQLFLMLNEMKMNGKVPEGGHA
jgi:biopolymer transport protein ExbB/TolQ